MKYLESSNCSVRLVKLENGEIGFAAKIAPLVKKSHYWASGKEKAIYIFYPAELVKAGKCKLTTHNIFGYEAECENETHFFPSHEALGKERITLSCEDAYLLSNCDHRQNNPTIGVHVKESPTSESVVYGIKKGTSFIPLQEMDNSAKYTLLHV